MSDFLKILSNVLCINGPFGRDDVIVHKSTKLKTMNEIPGDYHKGIFSQSKKIRKGAGKNKLTRAQRKINRYLESIKQNKAFEFAKEHGFYHITYGYFKEEYAHVVDDLFYNPKTKYLIGSVILHEIENGDAEIMHYKISKKGYQKTWFVKENEEVKW